MNPSISVIQKYLLRIMAGQAGRTIKYRGRIVEIIDDHDSLRLLMPLVELDLSESNYAQMFWSPRRQLDRKRLNVERRDKTRRHLTIGTFWGDSRPKYARRKPLRSYFPSFGFLRHLVADLGYDRRAALAALAQPRKFNGRAPTRRTLTGGFSEAQVQKGLSRMQTTDSVMKTALFEIVYRRQSTQVIAAKTGISRAKLDVYASRLREHIRQEATPQAA